MDRILATPDSRQRALARLLDKVSPEPNSGCWLWTGVLGKDGYGFFWVPNGTAHGRFVAAHRASFVLHGGTLAPGMCVCHRCDVPQCVNPGHLFAGSHKQNMCDALAKGRLAGFLAAGRINGKAQIANLRPFQSRGSAHPRAKLNETTARFIVRSRETHTALARLLGVSTYAVRDVRDGRCWSHVTGVEAR